MEGQPKGSEGYGPKPERQETGEEVVPEIIPEEERYPEINPTEEQKRALREAIQNVQNSGGEDEGDQEKQAA